MVEAIFQSTDNLNNHSQEMGKEEEERGSEKIKRKSLKNS